MRKWTGAALLSLAVCVVGTVAIGQSLGLALRGSANTTARRLAPYDARLAGIASQAAIYRQPDTLKISAGELALARQSLERDPTGVNAVLTLAMKAELDREPARAKALFGYAAAMSRRDLRTHLWLIEDAVRRENVAEALGHYDLALRSNASARALLFPVLAAAISEDKLRSGLTAILSERPLWSDGFVNFITTQGPDVGAAANLMVALRQRKYPFAPGVEDAMVGSLLKAGEVDAAWTYYARMHADARRDTLRNGRFDRRAETPSPFDWNLSTDSGSISIDRTAEGSALSFAMASIGGGEVARQLQVLPAGRYRLSGTSDRFGAPRPYWTLACTDGRGIARVDLAAQDRSDSYAGIVTVPAGCPTQWLVLVVPPGDGDLATSGTLRSVALSRLP